jgi:biotin-dependent carboxylase-like uncharacterized protein
MIEVVDPGGLMSVQDVRGRRAWQRFGVPLGGAADPWSARLANRLVGNADDAAVLEMLGGGAVLRLETATTVAVSGGLTTTVDGVPMPPDAARRVAPGSRLRLGAGGGLRGYLAVRGGLDVAPVLGSRATDLRTGFGGVGGRALVTGDRLAVGPDDDAPAYRWLGTREGGPLRLTTGPQAASASMQALTGTAWRVGEAVDRTGVRLDGVPLTDGSEVASQGLLPGAIQVPPDGLPILMLADAPVTGGYGVPACLIGADLGRLAQLRPGDEVVFVEVGIEVARDAWRRAEAALDALEPLAPPSHDGTGWAGSHG